MFFLLHANGPFLILKNGGEKIKLVSLSFYIFLAKTMLWTLEILMVPLVPSKMR